MDVDGICFLGIWGKMCIPLVSYITLALKASLWFLHFCFVFCVFPEPVARTCSFCFLFCHINVFSDLQAHHVNLWPRNRFVLDTWRHWQMDLSVYGDVICIPIEDTLSQREAKLSFIELPSLRTAISLTMKGGTLDYAKHNIIKRKRNACIHKAIRTKTEASVIIFSHYVQLLWSPSGQVFPVWCVVEKITSKLFTVQVKADSKDSSSHFVYLHWAETVMDDTWTCFNYIKPAHWLDMRRLAQPEFEFCNSLAKIL